MAQSGFTPIQLYRSATPGAVPLAADLAAGELALNTADEKLFFENASGSVVSIDAANGTVTSVALSGGTTGLTVSGSPITTSGTITLAGTLAVANGGTGVTTSTGTTAIVLSNSPTLVTPILGAATATSIANGLGAAGTPSYTFTGDLNTGVWSPAADTVAVSTGGSERMRIDSFGKVGIGTTGITYTLDVRDATGAVISAQTSSGNAALRAASLASGVALVQLVSSPGTQTITGGLGSVNNMAFSVGGTERMRIDSAGDVGIGTTNPLFPLEVIGEVRGTKFTSDAASQSLANNTDLAILTLTGYPGPQIYQVSVAVNAGAGTSMTVALVTVGTNGSGGRSAALTKLVTSAAFGSDITVTNVAGTSTVNVKQTTGVTQTISWSITRLM
jgi:hypothetical protein